MSDRVESEVSNMPNQRVAVKLNQYTQEGDSGRFFPKARNSKPKGKKFDRGALRAMRGKW